MPLSKSRSYEMDVFPNSGPGPERAHEENPTSSSEQELTSSGEDSHASEAAPAMRRELGLTGAVSLIVGGIIGSGIFVSPAGVLDATGSVGLSLLVWVGAGLIALMGSLCYSELGTLIPKSGGDYSYVREAFGDMVAFLYIWVSIILIRPSSLAVMSLTFGTYFAAVFDLCGKPQIFVRLAAVACLVTVMLLNAYSTRVASRATIISTFFKVAALLVIVGGGVVRLVQGHTAVLSTGFKDSTTNPTTISLALYDALWAYDGWINLNTVTEELKKPQRNLPLANIGSVVMVIIVYVATNIAYLSTMSTREMLDADAVAVVYGDRVLKGAAVLIPISVMVSTFGSCNSTAFSGGRPVFAAARDGNLPRIFSYIHIHNLTPMPSVVFTVGMAIVFVFLGDISSLIDFFSFTAWLFYGMNFIALLVFRYTKPDHPRPYKCPIVIPIVMILVALYLLIAPIVNDPAIEFLYAVLFILAGAIFYFPFVKYRLEPPFAGKLVAYLQVVMEVVPPTKYVE